MESPAPQRRKSNRTPKSVNFDDYDDAVFEDDSMLPDELVEEEGTFEK
jgi:hypothetical protein